MTIPLITADTIIMTNIGTTVAQRGITTPQFKAKFDEGLTNIKTDLNTNIIPAMQTVETTFATHLADNARHISGIKVGSFTRDMSTASGTQVITGVGFQGKIATFHAVVDSTIGKISWGFDSGSARNCMTSAHLIAAGEFLDAGGSIHIYGDGSNRYYGQISAWGADGFTINWTKVGSPTGTIVVHYTIMG